MTLTDRVTPNPSGLPVRRELLELLESADPTILLLCLVDLTGDTALLERYAGAFEPRAVRTVQKSHDFDPAVAQDIRQRLADRLGEPPAAPTEGRDEVLFRRLASFTVGEQVDDEFVPLLLEQAGFEKSRRRVAITRQPPEGFHVIVIGAGMTGINAGVKLSEAGFGYTILEQRSELGGVWSVNKYPGAAVDTPSHYYSFSFETNPEWTHYFPAGPEYLEYLKRVADKYGVIQNIRFDTTVIGCRWEEDTAEWFVTADSAGRRSEYRANAIFTATGVLNRPYIPEIPGRDEYTGTAMHGAEWDPEVNLSGKRVVLLGTGCTAVQIATEIATEVESLTVVQRQAHWMNPGSNGSEVVPDPFRWVLSNVPYYDNWFRLKTYWYASDINYEVPRIDPEWQKTHLSASPANDRVLRACTAYLERKLAGRPDLIGKLTPDFPPFAKRIVKDPGFLDTLLRDNVELLMGTIERYRPGGVAVTGGLEVDCDVVILATGFHLDWLSTLDISGRDGAVLNDVWETGLNPFAYLGVTVPGFPNFFVSSGPNSNPNHGGGQNITSEEQVHYLVECLQLLVEQGASAMEPTQEATDAYSEAIDAEMDKTVWKHGGTAGGYYRNEKGRAVVACPWRMVDYWSFLREPDPEHYRFTVGATAGG